MTFGPKPRDVAERFWEKADKSSDCWIWKGTEGSDGYGRFYLDGKNKSARAHRVAYTLTHGEPEFMVLHHCDTPLCVRPEHLYDGNQSQNMRDKVARNPDWNAMTRKTHCKNGHGFTPENTRYRKGKYQRVCKRCEADAQAQYRKRRHGT